MSCSTVETVERTAGENSFGAPKKRNNFDVIKISTHRSFHIKKTNIELFYNTPCKVITFNIFCFFFGISSMLLFLITLAVALVGRAITT